jgi:hypothetical protein
MSDNKNMHSTSGIGVVTLFVVLLILCLTVFAVLTFASANADLRLSEKNAEMVEAYYIADNMATLVSEDVSAFWRQGAPKPDMNALGALVEKIQSREGIEKITYASDNRGITVSYGVFVDTLLTLEVELSLPRGGVCEVLSWRVMADEPSFEEEMLPVWEG